MATPDVVILHQFSEALDRLSCDELEQLIALYERRGIGLEGAERSADAEANVVPLKAPLAAEEMAADVGEPSAAPPSMPAPASSPPPPAPVLPSAPATSPAATIAPVTEGYVGRVAPVVRARSGFHVSARRRRSQSDIEKARMALAGGYERAQPLAEAETASRNFGPKGQFLRGFLCCPRYVPHLASEATNCLIAEARILSEIDNGPQVSVNVEHNEPQVVVFLPKNGREPPELVSQAEPFGGEA